MSERLDPLDLYDIRSLLSDEERLVQESVRRFVEGEALPVIRDAFAASHFPRDLIPAIAALGLLGSTLKEHGGAGLNSIGYGLICQELERGDSGLRSFVSVQSSLAMGAIDRFASAEQKARWLPGMVRGETIGCFGLTESHGGSDPGAMKTRAVRSGAEWVLNGSKMWITNGTFADIAIVWAATAEGIGAFVVETDSGGFEARGIHDKFSLRASDTAELFLSDVRVPEENRLPQARGLGAALACLDQARFGIVWGAIGAAQACLLELLEYTSTRTLFGRTLAQTQLIQARLADAARRITSAQTLALRLAQLKDAGRVTSTQISLAKWNNVRMALDIARDCRDMLGGAGITIEHATIRHMLNLESVITYEGTESIHQLVVGRALTGHSAF